MFKNRGFTLVELMVVVAIIGIVGAVAIPAYRSYVQRAQRTDAMVALLRIAQQQEKYYLQNNTYTTDLAALNVSGTENGYYALEVTAADAVTFSAQATPVSTEKQATDTDCSLFTLDDQGVKYAEDGGGGDNTATCWR